MSSIGRQLFQLGFECSPIILTGGVATAIPGEMLPIVAITEAANFLTGLLDGGTERGLDSFFAHFVPMPGATLVDNAIGRYPFANQTVAANAIIKQPLRVSLRMICPVNTEGGYVAKLATFSALQAVLDSHNAQGGLYTVATPSFIYTNCILVNLRDISGGDSKQAQTVWQWDFEKPLVTLNDAQQAQNAQMARITNSLPTDGALSGTPATLNSILSGAAPSTIPAAQPLAGVSAAVSNFVPQQ